MPDGSNFRAPRLPFNLGAIAHLPSFIAATAFLWLVVAFAWRAL